jgi:hypothetical protein
MYDAMYGTTLVYVDDFNDAVVGNNWGPLGFATMMVMSGTEATGVLGTNYYGGTWVRDLGSTKHYAQAIFTGTTGVLSNMVACRLPAYSPAINAGNTGYWGGIDFGAGTPQLILFRGSTQIATAASTITYPTTIRLETEAAAGNSVDIRLYQDGVLKINFNDTNAARILTGTNTGLSLRSNSGSLAKATNWECGRF